MVEQQFITKFGYIDIGTAPLIPPERRKSSVPQRFIRAVPNLPL